MSAGFVGHRFSALDAALDGDHVTFDDRQSRMISSLMRMTVSYSQLSCQLLSVSVVVAALDGLRQLLVRILPQLPGEETQRFLGQAVYDPDGCQDRQGAAQEQDALDEASRTRGRLRRASRISESAVVVAADA